MKDWLLPLSLMISIASGICFASHATSRGDAIMLFIIGFAIIQAIAIHILRKFNVISW